MMISLILYVLVILFVWYSTIIFYCLNLYVNDYLIKFGFRLGCAGCIINTIILILKIRRLSK